MTDNELIKAIPHICGKGRHHITVEKAQLFAVQLCVFALSRTLVREGEMDVLIY
jgi:hypothetical protein